MEVPNVARKSMANVNSLSNCSSEAYSGPKVQYIVSIVRVYGKRRPKVQYRLSIGGVYGKTEQQKHQYYCDGFNSGD